MKTKMLRFTFWAFMLLFLLSASCKKQPVPTPAGWERATFTGVDYRMCVCCGGYYFTLHDTTFRALDVVNNTVLNEHTWFPKDYFIKYEIPSGGCYGGGASPAVKVTAIKEIP
jgi:hypothetical protein